MLFKLWGFNNKKPISLKVKRGYLNGSLHLVNSILVLVQLHETFLEHKRLKGTNPLYTNSSYIRPKPVSLQEMQVSISLSNSE